MCHTAVTSVHFRRCGHQMGDSKTISIYISVYSILYLYSIYICIVLS